MQMNSTWNRATGSIPYVIVFNRQPAYRRVPVEKRPFEEVEVRELDPVEEELDILANIASTAAAGEVLVTTTGAADESEEHQLHDHEDDPGEELENTLILEAMRRSEEDELVRQRCQEAERNREANKNTSNADDPMPATVHDPFSSRPAPAPRRRM
ncbi:MAG: hypothetical protein Q9182_007437, partial [Xanthomendoza sp. 2 TL-2023]